MRYNFLLRAECKLSNYQCRKFLQGIFNSKFRCFVSDNWVNLVMFCLVDLAFGNIVSVASVIQNSSFLANMVKCKF